MEFRILGPLEVLDGATVVPIPGAKERAVLAFLLLRAGEVVAADHLLDELWGEEAPESAHKSLRVRIAALRKVLGPDRILIRPPGYRAVVRHDSFDLDRFQHLAAEARRAEPIIAAGLLREALGLWRGPALADFQRETWAQGAIARLDELRLAALEGRIDADLALGRHAELVGELKTLVTEHGLRERLHAQLMLALYRAGRQAEALDAYATARRRLVDGLGLEPGEALQSLQRAVLRHDPALQLAEQPAAERVILVVSLAEDSLDRLLDLARVLARRPRRDLMLIRPVATVDALAHASAELERRRAQLLGDGIGARGAAFTSASPGDDVVRIAAVHDVDLIIVDGSSGLLDHPALSAILGGAPCDVAVLAGGALGPGAVLVPFTGAEHDWSAVEIGAWFSRARDVPLRIAGPVEGPRDSSRLLADASLAIQRALGVAAEPLLLEAGADQLLGAAEDAGLVVAGLNDRWRRAGVGPVRSTLAAESKVAVLLVRRGLRPGGLAPPGAHTRFTWSVGAGA